MTIWPQHFPGSLLSKLTESNSRNNKDELNRLPRMPRTFSRNCDLEWMWRILSFLNFPSNPRRFFSRPHSSSGTRLLRGEGRGFSPQGCSRCDAAWSSTFWSIVRLLAPADRIDGTNRGSNATRLKASCQFSCLFFWAKQNHFAIRANFIAIFEINRRGRRLSEMGTGCRRDRNLSARQNHRPGWSYLFGLAMKNVQLTLPRFQFNPRCPN